MKKMRYIFILLTILFSLSSCGKTQTENKETGVTSIDTNITDDNKDANKSVYDEFVVNGIDGWTKHTDATWDYSDDFSYVIFTIAHTTLYDVDKNTSDSYLSAGLKTYSRPKIFDADIAKEQYEFIEAKDTNVKLPFGLGVATYKDNADNPSVAVIGAYFDKENNQILNCTLFTDQAHFDNCFDSYLNLLDNITVE